MQAMEILKKCLNPKVLVGLGLVAAAVLIFAPKPFFASLPLLVLAACPISMVVMIAAMRGKGQSKK